ncbi:mrna transport regulator [Lasallia pustulata]|uniref:Mrna transport regulator n=1 Tax=Lasallia pustulata TaxID=136370 RepID=A0A1W5DCC6_9LECA|nr:mrna transport regulator [Lasallia pustulata]
MASAGPETFAPVLAALATMQANVERAQKSQAHEYLESFQKSSEAWTTTHTILSSTQTSAEAKLFAATTLKGKIIYDLDQLPRDSLPALRDSILSLLTAFRQGPRPIRTQLCVCLANLAIQMLAWKNVLQLVGSTLGSAAGDCVLEFLRVLPEEVIEGRRINLTEEELRDRTRELLEDNAQQVLRLLVQYSQSSASASSNPHLLECISSWLREIPAAEVVNSPLLDAVINALSVDASFEAAVDCICTIYRDTREVDESLETIQTLYPRIIALRPKIAAAADSEDQDAFKGITRLFAEAGEAWVVLIARLPNEFRSLVESVLECCARDRDRDAISLTFLFWFEFKQMITLEKYKQAQSIYADVFAKLVDVMMKHLEFPTPESPDETDLFDGDREQEERFREFRHAMGDVLKNCCEVIGVTECLGKSFQLIQQWISNYGRQATKESVPHWQELEAPLFSMRAMGRMVSPEEDIVLRQVIPLIVQIPNHEKIRFQAIMALARYTEWTAQHPEFLQPQLNYILAGFNHESKEVVRAAALAFKFCATDCKKLLRDEVTHLHKFYEHILDKLPPASQEEVTEGVAAVVSVQPLEKIYPTFKLYCDPIMARLMARANDAKNEEKDEGKLAVADHLQLLTIFIQNIQPYVSPSEANPAVKYCQEILPVLSRIAENFTSFTPILERVCRCWRHMVLSYRTAILPLLPSLAQQLASGFENSRQGCFLWATDSVLREFALGAEFVDGATSQAIYNFFEQQAVAFLRIMNDLPPKDLPDVIEDFFHLLIDALIYYHQQLILAPVCGPILSAALSALVLEQVEPLTAALHFLRDFLSYGTSHPNSSNFNSPDAGDRPANPAEIQSAVRQMVASQGEVLIQRVMAGMMFTFPRDCLADASGVLLVVFELMPEQVAVWVRGTIAMLPAGTVKVGDADRLMNAIAQKIQVGDMRKIRVLLQDFTNSYRRRNVAPRDGLGRLEATRFRFSG